MRLKLVQRSWGGQRKRRNGCGELFAIRIEHVIAAVHGTDGCFDDCAAGVLKRFAGFNVGLLANNAFALNLLNFAV